MHTIESLQRYRLSIVQICVAGILGFGFMMGSEAKEVCKLKYKGDINGLKGKTFQVDEQMVAMSSEIKVTKPPLTVISKIEPAAIFFIIDNSGSMGSSGGNQATDQNGTRFNVIHDFIDTIKAKFDSVAQVGVAVYGTYLYYNPIDNPIFKQCPGYDTGAYIPLLGLNKSYPPNGITGYDLLRTYLDTTIKGTGTNAYVDLKYTPTQPFPVGNQIQSTCINAGFDAAKDAFSTCGLPKNRQFIIFLSDGEANIPIGTAAQNFQTGTNVPTTFTVYFTRNGTVVPTSIQTMTTNIKANGYSSKNPSSNLWPIKTDYPALMKLLVDSVLNTISLAITNKPDSIVVNGSLSMFWDSVNNIFCLNKLLPLTGTTTSFNYRIKYTIFKKINDSVIIPVDSVAEGNFAIALQNGTVTPDTFAVYCWDRVLGFYNNNTKLTQANLSTTPLELRFSFDTGAARYSYSNATIELRTKGVNNQADKEYIQMLKIGNIFSGVINLQLDSSSIPVSGNGILQVNTTDMIYAVFRNTEIPKLPLDTLIDSIPFNAFTGIQTDQINPARSFSWFTTKNTFGSTMLVIKSMPLPGEVSVFTTNGKCVLKQKLFRGDARVLIPSMKSTAMYLVHLKYGNVIVKKKVIF